MVKRCAWGTCNSDTRYKNHEHMKNVTFFPIPKPKTKLKETLEWVKACNRKDFTVKNVNKHSYVCSKHFVDGRPTANFPCPVIAGETRNQQIKSKRKPPKRSLEFIPLPIETKAKPRNVTGTPTKGNDIVPDAAVFLELSTETVECCASGEILLTHDSVIQVPDEDDSEYLQSSEHGYASKKSMTDQCTQTTVTMEHLKDYEDQSLMDEGCLRRHLVLKDVMKDNESCKFYTGLSVVMLQFIFTFLLKSAKSMTYWRGNDTNNDRSQTPKRGAKRLLNFKEEIILTLMRLRRGIDTISIGNIFGISDSSVSRIFITWTTLMSKELGFLIRWPSKEQARYKLPSCFKHFSKTRCIIDCTEFFIQKPSLPSSQRITYSSYKHHNTLKCLVGITPRGSFSFVSDLYTGSISDKKLVLQSGFLDHVEYGDDIMADRGFLIRGELAERGATLNIPPFAMGNQMCSAATTKTRRIAHARIHVERAIGRLKNFTILQGTLPLRMKSCMDSIVRTCAILCNLDKQLVK